MPAPPEPVETLAEGRFLALRRQGRWEYAERVRGRCAVIIVAVTPSGNLLLVDQYRIPVAASSIEMPAGLVGDHDADDTVAEAARRELEEETGWRAANIELLTQGPSSSGMSNEIVWFARATGLERVGEGGGDETEDIRVIEVPVADAAAFLHRKAAEGYAIDPKLYAGLYFIDRNADGSPA